MKSRIIFFQTLIATSLIFSSGCSVLQGKGYKKTAATEPKASTKEVAKESSVLKSDQVDYATLEFDKGEVQLSEMDRRLLNELASKMTRPGKVVDDIKILTWADRTVKNDQEASNTEIILARQRAEAIKNYLERNLPAEEDIDFYNMAENPQRFSRYMERKGVRIDDAFKENGNKGTSDGKALVIIEYQSGPMPSTL